MLRIRSKHENQVAQTFNKRIILAAKIYGSHHLCDIKWFIHCICTVMSMYQVSTHIGSQYEHDHVTHN